MCFYTYKGSIIRKRFKTLVYTKILLTIVQRFRISQKGPNLIIYSVHILFYNNQTTILC